MDRLINMHVMLMPFDACFVVGYLTCSFAN